jgi:hypothetical protein
MGATSETRTLNTLLVTSANKYLTKVIDNVNKANIVFYVLSQEGFKKTQDGGERIEIPLRMTKSTSGGWYENYDLLDTTPADPLTKAFYIWRQIHYSVVMSRLEQRKNSGIGQTLDMMQALFDDAEDSLTQDINSAVFSTPSTSSPKPIDGLLALVPEDPSSASGGRAGDGKIGGIDQNAETWWRNKAIGNGGSSFVWAVDTGDTPVIPTSWAAMEYLYENCSKGGGPRDKREPNLGVCNQLFYRNYLGSMTPLRRFTDSKLADIGFRNIMFNDMPISWDEDCTSATAGTNTYSCCYFLNKYFMHLVVDTQTDFYRTPFVRPANQDARICQILWYGNLGASSRRKQGLFIDYNITNRT